MNNQNTPVFTRQEIVDLQRQGFLKGYGEEEFVLALSKEDFDLDFFKRLFVQFLIDGGNITNVIHDVKYRFHQCGSEDCCR